MSLITRQVKCYLSAHRSKSAFVLSCFLDTWYTVARVHGFHVADRTPLHRLCHLCAPFCPSPAKPARALGNQVLCCPAWGLGDHVVLARAWRGARREESKTLINTWNAKVFQIAQTLTLNTLIFGVQIRVLAAGLGLATIDQSENIVGCA